MVATRAEDAHCHIAYVNQVGGQDELIFDGGVTVSARPSDSIALALRTGVPVHADESVLAEAGLVIPDEQEDEVEKFREFLDSVSPEDFRGAQPG